MNECKGHCCRIFFLPFTPEELVEADVFDGDTIRAMTIYRGRFSPEQYREYCRRRGLSTDEGAFRKKEGELGNYYTCRHLNELGRCDIYERRPKMCAEFPYNHACQFNGCDHGPGLRGRELIEATAEVMKAADEIEFVDDDEVINE